MRTLDDYLERILTVQDEILALALARYDRQDEEERRKDFITLLRCSFDEYPLDILETWLNTLKRLENKENPS